MSALLLATGWVGCAQDEGPNMDAGVMVDAGPGPQWEVMQSPSKAQLLAVWGRSETDVYAVGWEGTVLHYDGVAWAQETTTSTQPLTSIGGIPTPYPSEEMPMPMVVDGPIYAVGWQGTILERTVGGAWQPAAGNATVSADLFGLAMFSETQAMIVGEKGTVLSHDGTRFREVTFEVPGEFSMQPIQPRTDLKGIATANGTRYFFTGSGGLSYRANVNGQGAITFGSLDTRLSTPLRGVFSLANNLVYSVGLDGLVLRYTNRWRKANEEGVEELPNVFLFGVHGNAPENVYAVGWRGVAVHFDGETWTIERTGIDTDLRSVWVDPVTGTAFAVGAAGTIIRRIPDPVEMTME